MVYAKHIEESNISKINRDVKRECSDEPSQPKSKKRFYNKDSSMLSKDRVSNKNSQGRSGGGTTYERNRCTTCGKQQLGKCLAGTDWCFGYGIKVHKMRYFPTLKAKREGDQQNSSRWSGT